jgi:hypothetical protein
MKIIIAASAGWIVFCLGDYAFFGGRIVQSLPSFARAMLPGLVFLKCH